MITNDMISQATEKVRRINLDKMRACYTEYSTDFDGRAECRDYETKIKNAQTKARNLAWTKEIYVLRDTRLSAAAAKYYTLKNILDGMVKESDAIVASDLAARQARAKSIDAEYDKYAGILSNEKIADARTFVRNYYATPSEVLMFCQKATSSEIKRFEARLDQNFKDNGHKAAAYELDKKFAALSPIQRNHAYFTTADATIAQIQRTSSDIKNFCTVATIGAINKFVSDINAEKKYLECEEQIDRLAAGKTRTVAWCQRAWNEYKGLLSNISQYRNAQKLRDLNDEATRIYTDVTCEPYTNALNGRVSFKEIISLDEGLKTFKEKDILKKGIPSFDDKWPKKVAEAWAEARKQATEYYKQGNIYYGQKQYEKALGLFRDAEKYGNTDAYYMIGEHYYYGYAVSKSRDMACDYYNKAAELGNINAMIDLGILYETSRPETSFKWRSRAVAAGNNRAALDLAKMYFDGRGTARNYGEAKLLFEKLAKEGNEEANAYLGNMYEKALYVQKNESLALEYYKKGLSVDWVKKAYDKLSHKLDEERRDNEIEEQLALAKRGDPNAQRFIGECYYNGYRTTQSYEMAFEWFKKAAAHGNGRAMSLLGDMYVNGHGVKQDLKKAKKYYKDAIKHGEK